MTKNVSLSLLAVALASGIFFCAFCGFYTIQPIGALPEGRTIVVWRAAGEPFFNSPDAQCLEKMGGVSLMCRAFAVGAAPVDRVIVRLPYSRQAYLISTDGREFSPSSRYE
jgi:hypothetical protein